MTFGEMQPTSPSEAVALANRIFFARHPERRGRPISAAEPQLAREWMAIRAGLAGRMPPPYAPPRPAPYVPPSGVPGLVQGVSACPIEDPYPRYPHKVGMPCAPDGRKCWPREGWVDLVDPDMPCNDAAQRSPAAYATVLDYFNVAHPGNARYAPDGRDTFCNIYVHDVTRAMRASIPHWVRDPAQTAHRPIGWRELGANDTYDWLASFARQIGWILVDPAFCAAIARAQTLRQGAPLPDATLPLAIAAAAGRIAAAPHAAPQLLQQDTYVAQQFANMGLPAMIAYRSHTGPGHVAMIRPETPDARGAMHATGKFLPITAQAGARNWSAGRAGWIIGHESVTRLYVHA